MKRIKLLSLAITALVALASTAWAGPHGGGGGGNFGGGGFGGGHGGFSGAHLGGFGGGHFVGGPVGGFNGGGIRAAPTFSGGAARFSGNRNMVGLSRAPQRFSYYGGPRTSAVVPRASARQLPNRSTNSNAGRVASLNRQPNRVSSSVGQKRVTNPRFSTAENRQAFVKNHAFARHDGNWHRDWNKHHAHFDHGHVFVFVGGFWWGLNPWDYYPDGGYGYGDYPNDYSYDYPYDSSGYPYDAQYTSSSPYSYYNGYAPAGQYSNAVVNAVQSKLASLGYYHGAIDGVLGDESQAALAQYQQDQDLSVTGTVTAATLRALDLPYSGL
jgi:Putative peptidoglycan binding domain